MIENIARYLSLLIKLLMIPVLVLASVLLYRLDRILSSGVHSVEVLERTAENVEKSSQTVYDVTSLMRKLPFVRTREKEEKDE